MKTVGILGGMGPLATVDLFAKITRLTKAANDQEHLHILIDSNTNIPDRTRAISENGASPVKEMVRSALRLENMGADFLIIPCNTAHYFINRIKSFTRLPFINMIEETAKEAKRSGVSYAGLLATKGTIKTKLYTEAFVRQGVNLITPSEENEKHIMNLIYHGVKAGVSRYPLDGVNRTLKEMKNQGVEKFILGCTEMPLAVQMYHMDIPVIDPTEILARRTIECAGGKTID